MDLLSTLLSAAPALYSDFTGGTSAPYLKQQQQQAANNTQIAGALADPTSPMYQQVYGQYKQQNQNNLAQVIAEAQGQNRMNANMGRTPLFNANTGNGDIFRNLTQGYQNAGVESDQQTRSALQGALQGGAAALGGYNSISPSGAAANAQKLSGFDTLANLLKTKQTPTAQPNPMGSGMYSNYNNPATSSINWNQPAPTGYGGY